MEHKWSPHWEFRRLDLQTLVAEKSRARMTRGTRHVRQRNMLVKPDAAFLSAIVFTAAMWYQIQQKRGINHYPAFFLVQDPTVYSKVFTPFGMEGVFLPPCCRQNFVSQRKHGSSLHFFPGKGVFFQKLYIRYTVVVQLDGMDLGKAYEVNQRSFN